MGFLEQRKKQLNIKSLAEKVKSGEVSTDPTYSLKKLRNIHGPEWVDCLERRWSKGDVIGLIAGAGVGKCLAKDTPVLMYDGSIKNVQDVMVGDRLMGPDSSPRHVMSLARGRETMYRITSSKGESYTVNASHILSLKWTATESRRGYKKNQIVNMNVEEYLALPNKIKSGFKGYRVAVDFPKIEDTIIDPYLIGVFLGDGSKLDGRISNNDFAIIDYFRSFATNNGLSFNLSQPEGRCLNYYISNNGKSNPYRNEILNCVDSENNKFIPKKYLLNSRENRLKLLAGLIDTDGYLSNNCYEIIAKDNRLAEDIIFLCRSLGFAVTTRKKKSSIKSRNFTGEYNRLLISGNIDEIPVIVERRKAQPRKQIKDVLNYGFAVEKLPEDNYYGFTIDGDHLFLLGDFTVTHNTSTILNIFDSILTNNPNGIVCFVSLEMTAQEIADKWFKLTHSKPELSERLFIVENYDENDKCKHLSVAGIKNEISLIKNSLNSDVLAVAIDHLHEVNNEGSDNYNMVMSEMKNLAIEMDTVTFVLSQTTKAKGIGDIPIPKDGCYNCSRFEWICSYVITICQPLKRVQDQCEFPVLAFQYAKIRFKNRKDKLKEGMNYLLFFDFDEERLRPLSNAEKSEFTLWYDAVLELREAEEDRKDFQFDITQEIKGKDGKVVKLKSTVGGRARDDIEDF